VLVALTAEFPFVEWGILLSKSRFGEPRYPSVGTFAAFAQSGISGHMAVHLCGEEARRCFAGEGPPKAQSNIRRQVNGFTKFVDEHGLLTPLGEWIASHGAEVILQVQHERALSVARLLADIHPNVSALWDESGGRGVRGAWPDAPPGLKMGYAGGITPDNVKEAIELVLAKPGDAETWIDMESGVRTDDVFDIAKVRSVLTQAAPYITGAPRPS